MVFVAQRSWLPLWGSCHGTAVTERALSAPVGGTSPIGRGKTLPDKHQFIEQLRKPDMCVLFLVYPVSCGGCS